MTKEDLEQITLELSYIWDKIKEDPNNPELRKQLNELRKIRNQIKINLDLQGIKY